jgi:hypothetical protein
VTYGDEATECYATDKPDLPECGGVDTIAQPGRRSRNRPERLIAGCSCLQYRPRPLPPFVLSVATAKSKNELYGTQTKSAMKQIEEGSGSGGSWLLGEKLIAERWPECQPFAGQQSS